MNRSDLDRNAYMLCGSYARKGYMRWWHSFGGVSDATGERRIFFVEYLIYNPARKNPQLSYAMVRAGVFPTAEREGCERYVCSPISELRAARKPFVMEMADCFYSENRIAGEADDISWDLEVHKATACHTGFLGSAAAQILHMLESYWHGEGICAFYQGNITVAGENYTVTPEDCHGYADKHWGQGFNRPILQLTSGCLTSKLNTCSLKHSALAVHGCIPRFFFLPLKRRLMIQLTYRGEDYEFGLLRPGLLSRCRWTRKRTEARFVWHIKAQSRDALIRISYSCRREGLMTLHYENADGSRLEHAIHAGCNGEGTIELYRIRNGQEELVDRLRMTDGFCMMQ